MTTSKGLPRRAVMVDVARAAGVSHQTVSRVLNGHPSVAPATKARVYGAIEELGYRRNPAARALVTRRSHVIGVVSFGTTLYGPASTLFGIEQAASRAGYFVSVASLEAIDRQHVREAVARLSEQSVDGVVVIAPQQEAVDALSEVPAELPVVVVEGGEGAGRSLVCVDQAAGAALVTRHLLEQGAPTVWHVAGPVDWLEAQARTTGWRRELEDGGAKVPEPLHGDWSPASGYACGQVLAERADVRAVFVANDQMALGVLRAFHERGVRVPGDVLVAGFDDVPEAAYFTPPLTTIRQDFTAVGHRSIDLLLGQIDHGDQESRMEVVPPELVVRQSTIGQPRH
ncbi:MAG: LacI family DNA-binding transcriptional regulator [Actinobacteria bacterium]|nr:LacI family DNA-binding transcriptional regulator [Actinomycetota bacterium]